MRVLVTGASGTLGRATVPVLTAAGHDVVGLSRSARSGPGTWVQGDLATGEGIADAVRHADAVVHLASAPYRRDYTRRVDIEGTQRLASAARSAGVAHLLYVSIIGVDRVPWGYYRTKVAAEDVVRSAGLGWTVLRATQFHGLLDAVLHAVSRIGVIPYDRGVRAQPVDVGDVARHLLDLLHAGPAGAVTEFAGPEVLATDDAVRQWLDITGTRRLTLPIRIPGGLGAGFRAGHLTTTAQPTGTVTWADYLTARYAVDTPLRECGSSRSHPEI